MTKLSRCILLLWCISYVYCGQVVYEDCDGIYELYQVFIDECDKTVPCYLTVGTYINVTATYISSGQKSVSLTHKVFVLLNSVQTDAIVTPAPCEATRCPIQPQTETSYSAKLRIPSNVALNTRGILEWRLFNELGSKIICFKVFIQTQSQPDRIWRTLHDDIPEEVQMKL